jgi:hypothetical protein
MIYKSTLVTIALFISFIGFSQTQPPAIRNVDNIGINQSFIKPIGKGGYVEGSPYIMKAFQLAKVQNNVQNAMMRYNAANDEFEFISPKRDTLVLQKLEEFGDITFINLKTHYLFKNYSDKSGYSTSGYLIMLYDKNSIVLYKRQKINFSEAREAATPYGSSTPARYVPMKDTFFIQVNGSEIKELATNKKGIYKMFPEKKVALEAFFKENDLDLDEENGVIKLADFLGQ